MWIIIADNIQNGFISLFTTDKNIIVIEMVKLSLIIMCTANEDHLSNIHHL